MNQKEERNKKSEVISRRSNMGRNEEYEMEETLYRNEDGDYWLGRSFAGMCDELNEVRCDYVNNNCVKKLSAEDAQKWLERSKSSIQIPMPKRDSIDICWGTFEEEVDYDGSWFKALLDKHFDDTWLVSICVGFCFYNEKGHWWCTGSDVTERDIVLAEGKTSSELYDEVVSAFKKNHKWSYSNGPTVYIDKVILYNHEDEVIRSIKNTNLKQVYAKLARNVENYDVMSWE